MYNPGNVTASENVPADRGRIALQRGPIVFCAEWPDTPNGKVRKLLLPMTSRSPPGSTRPCSMASKSSEGKGFNVPPTSSKNLQTPAGLQSHPRTSPGQPGRPGK